MKETTIYGRLVMAVKNTAQVVIGGKIITLGGYESEEYFQKVASYINNKIAELSEMPGYTRQPVETKHTLLSLNVTDDYFKAKKQGDLLEKDIEEKDKEMYDLKHELISVQIKLENSEKIIEILKEQNNDLQKEQIKLETEMKNHKK